MEIINREGAKTKKNNCDRTGSTPTTRKGGEREEKKRITLGIET